MRQSHRERGSDLSEHLLNAVLLVLVPLRRLRSLARERKRMCVLAWPLRCLFPSPLVLVPACGVCALQGVTVSREALCVTVCIQKHSRWKQILMLAPVSRNTPPLVVEFSEGSALRPTQRFWFCRKALYVYRRLHCKERHAPCGARWRLRAGTRGGGKRHRSGHARTHRRFRSRARRKEETWPSRTQSGVPGLSRALIVA